MSELTVNNSTQQNNKQLRRGEVASRAPHDHFEFLLLLKEKTLRGLENLKNSLD